MAGAMAPAPAGRINRFVVMAMLQAARARRLGLSEAAARSWGLNRSIFYAAAKRGFRARGAGEGGTHKDPSPGRPSGEWYLLGDEGAYRDPGSAEPRFTFGGKIQTPEEFDRQIAARFGTP